MKDETYAFISDVKEKKVTARSARHTRTHCGKGGRVRLPSDNLSKKELKKMSGECKSYRLNEPMTWAEFKAMPDDIKITYVKLLREKYDVPDCELYRMFGTDKDTLSRYFKTLGLRLPRKNVHREWKKDEFFAWLHGVKCIDELPDPFEEEPTEVPVIEEVHIEEPIQEEPEVFVDEDLPWNVPESTIEAKFTPFEEPGFVPVDKYEELMAVNEKYKEENAWMRKEWENDCIQLRILEAQMEVVRMIFGGKNNG